jgi:deoxyribodipyrimidine photolyase-related protein
MKNLVLIFGDQLSYNISSLDACDKTQDIILMCEVYHEATYVKHHKKKIAFIFSAMRHFAEMLAHNGYTVHYVKLDDPDNTGTFEGEVERTATQFKCQRIIVTEPSEYRVLENVKTWQQKFNIPVDIQSDNRFLCSHQEFSDWAKNYKQLRMEYFYRDMRKKYHILMDYDRPVGGEWNYDSENRKPPSGDLDIPKPYHGTIDAITQEVIDLVGQKFASHFGDLDGFYFAVTRDQALMVLEKFIAERLDNFGDYQDAMLENEPWMYHSHLSFYINIGLLNPLECIKSVEQAYYDKKVSLNATEGFIRQILGWREYIRGVYWLRMPEYATLNYFNATQNLPEFYWTANTKMNCVRQCVLETKKNAYAHHIQRLMVLGNFALLAGINPKYVNEWFLIVYADAFEWVEMPNVTGMILFADGGYLASKPYAAGGSYIHKMSNYCKKCSYKVTQKNGETACPFNYLYWNFLSNNRSKLSSNPRIAMMYRTYDKMDNEKKQAIRLDSERFLKNL